MTPSTPAGPVLRDIHLPPAPPWWPPAPGWWLLAGLVVLVLLAAGWAWRRHLRLQRRRRQWQGELDRALASHMRSGDVAELAATLHQLLRRVAREHVADAVQQRGAAWRQTLACVPVERTVLDRLAALETTIYRPTPPLDVPATAAAMRTWLRVAARPRAWKQAPVASHV